jgi:hypothetical protein
MASRQTGTLLTAQVSGIPMTDRHRCRAVSLTKRVVTRLQRLFSPPKSERREVPPEESIAQVVRTPLASTLVPSLSHQKVCPPSLAIHPWVFALTSGGRGEGEGVYV